jgi:hypothetical protein
MLGSVYGCHYLWSIPHTAWPLPLSRSMTPNGPSTTWTALHQKLANNDNSPSRWRNVSRIITSSQLRHSLSDDNDWDIRVRVIDLTMIAWRSSTPALASIPVREALTDAESPDPVIPAEDPADEEYESSMRTSTAAARTRSRTNQ